MGAVISVTDERCGRLSAIDPRLRIVAAVLFTIAVVVAQRFSTLTVALLTSLLMITVADLSWKNVFRRLASLNFIVIILFILLPACSHGSEVVFQLGPVGFSREGLRLATVIALKGNAIVLFLSFFLGGMDPIVLGHTLSHLYVPRKLALLLLFTVRYLDLLYDEYLRLRAAMKVRGFRAGINRHTYRSLGYLVGMLLVRSFDRAERIMAAMKCRCFQGQFFLLDHFAFSRCDVPFVLASTAILLLMFYLEWV
ncbi:MAG: cobalt ECF transporter T component CbiQ [Candidatus Jordarchaeaceae archaeon]